MEDFGKILEAHSLQDEERFKNIEEKIDNLPTKGDIEEMRKEIKEHMEAVQPFLQGAAGFGILWKILMAIGGVLVIWVQIKSLFGK